ncbi:MAG: N-acetyltransferase [Candidatus Paceibacterota bacterium]|jgi:ribosomal protein S18 acetylase RimI-like enzyme
MEDLNKTKNTQELGPVTLVEGTEADFETFFALEQRLAKPTYRAETKPEQIYGENKSFFMVKAGKKIVGQIQYERKENNIIYLNVLAIDPDFQGRGLGREAMNQFLSKFSSASKIWLVTFPGNIEAVNLYESLGFKITETIENYFGNGTPRVKMVLEH